MTPTRKRRLFAVLFVLLGVGTATGMLVYALSDNALFFYTPSKMAEEGVASGTKFRLGGMVQPGSVKRDKQSLAVSFIITDNDAEQSVIYEGILPDLFREGQGVIASGTLRDDGRFEAHQVLAKHDENYMPPEVADALREQGHELPSKPGA
jgi:cytochrome c-type biogenesis protein CcmE